MLRPAIITVFAITLGTILCSGSANATITVFGDMQYSLQNIDCFPPGCVATLDPNNPNVQVAITAGPGLPNVDVTQSVDFSLNINNSEAVNVEGVYLRVDYEFSMDFTNPLDVFGGYSYRDGFIAFGSCSYPPRGFVGVGPSGCSFLDFNEAIFSVQADTDMTWDFTGTINAQAGSLPEPPSVGILASALVIFGWLHRRHQNERTDEISPAIVAQSR